MPTYDYRCDANGRVVEVQHRMSEDLKTWGEICERAGIDLAGTDANAPVHRLITGGQIISSSPKFSASQAPACSTGSCSTGLCGLD